MNLTNYMSKCIGSIIAELNAYGNFMSGRFVGYGAKSERLVFGDIKLEKLI